jgi:MipA family protein
VTRGLWRFAGTTAGSWLAAWVLVALPPPALAQAASPGGASFELKLGLGVLRAPVYLGGEDHRTRALPVVSARWASGWFAGVGALPGLGGGIGMGHRFGGESAWGWGPVLRLGAGRDEDDAAALRGLGDIKPRPELGLFADLRLRPGLRLGASLHAGGGNEGRGVQGELSLRTMLPLLPSLRWTAGINATWTNSHAAQTHFGIDDEQSRRSVYPIFRAEGGLRELGLQTGLVWKLGPRTDLLLGVNATSLVGDARRSPLSRQRHWMGAMTTLSISL